MRAFLSDYLVARAKRESQFIVLSGDHGYALFDAIRKEAPESFLNCGVAEQNMVGMAAGMAAQGARPLLYGLSAFIPVRVLEQIKLDVCYSKLPVTFLGDGAGAVYSLLGVSHQSFEDIASLRSLPHIEIFSPADDHELKVCLERTEKSQMPSYVRIGKADRGLLHPKPLTANALQEVIIPVAPTTSGAKIALLGTGAMAHIALSLASSLKRSACDVFSVPMLKPWNSALLAAKLKNYSRVVTLEEHAETGGLGSAVSEVLSDHGMAIKLLRIGSPLKFSEAVGTHDFVVSLHGLDFKTILSRIEAFL